jgi:hypothetical protein
MDAYPYRHVDMHFNGVFETTETIESFLIQQLQGANPSQLVKPGQVWF